VASGERAEQVVRVRLDSPAETLPAAGAPRVAATVGDALVGECAVPPGEGAAVDRVVRALGDRAWAPVVRAALLRAARGVVVPPPAAPAPAASVVVTIADGAAAAEVLAAVRTVRREPDEVLVADPRGGDARIREACRAHGAEHLPRASWGDAALRARGGLVAVTSDRWLVDPAWLDHVDRTFEDPLVMASVPGAGRRRVVDGAGCDDPVGAAAELGAAGPAVLRLDGIAEAGLPAGCTYLLYRLLALGYRVVREPGQLAWPRAGDAHVDASALGELALRALVRHREPRALRLLRHAPRPPRAGARREVAAPRAAGGPPGPPPGPRDLPELTVVVPSYNRRDLLVAVLRALARQTVAPDRFDVVAVIDGSTDGSAEAARALDLPYALQVVEQPNAGSAAARNRGAAHASHPVLVFCDDDIVPEPQFVAAHARAHAAGDELRVALGYCPALLTERTRWALRRRTWWEDHFRRKGDPTLPWSANEFSVGNSSLHASLFARAGGLNEAFTLRGDDFDFGHRLERLGASFAYLPDARAWHHMPGDLRGDVHLHRLQARFDVLSVRRHPELAHRVVAASYALRPGGVSARLRRAYRHAGALARLQPAAFALAGAAERLRARRAYDRLTGVLMTHAYLWGLRDALGAEGLDPFLAVLRRESAPRVVPVELDEPGPVPVAEPLRRTLLRVTWRGEALGDVLAAAPGREWEWEELADRGVDALLPAVRRRVPFGELVRAAAARESVGA
jgi:GT2 family glycosyltransferase